MVHRATTVATALAGAAATLRDRGYEGPVPELSAEFAGRVVQFDDEEPGVQLDAAAALAAILDLACEDPSVTVDQVRALIALHARADQPPR